MYEHEKVVHMKHEDFPVDGFEFMNEPASEEQKDIIHYLSLKKGKPIERHGKWPNPFTKWDAKNMIDALDSLPDAGIIPDWLLNTIHKASK